MSPLVGVLDFDLVKARRIPGNPKCEATISFRSILGKTEGESIRRPDPSPCPLAG